MKKEEIKIFGEKSLAHIEHPGLFTYVVVRDIDNSILAVGYKFRKYKNDIVRTMYTGERYGTGDYILVSDLHGVIHKFE